MILEVEGLTHRYGDEPALEDVSFRLREGELLALLGPSGCGKTTVVQAVAGHLTPTDGRVRMHGTDVTPDPPEARRAGVVFQRPTLYPHMTVAENVGYGLAAREVDPARRDELVGEYLDLVELGDQRDAYPAHLSGGQTRRVELARALAPEPEVLLLDEPLSALDRSLRSQLRAEIARIQRETGVTTLFVTHDQEEAMSLADRLVILRNGRVSAVGDPRTLYESPPNPFVASFLGRSTPLPATVESHDPPRLRVGPTTVRIDTLPDVGPGEQVTVHVRPEHIELSASGPPPTDITLPGVVEEVTDVGNRYDVRVVLDSGGDLLVERTRPPPAVTEAVTVGLSRADLVVFPESTARPPTV